ncbi:hypothetical protein [Paenibacillus sp. N3.4]|uniref:hypothetical protein n=1 Tax=Paenibacillus sp. N3.4 TaxID=2603222 RepID=UPI0011C96D49|nr:hypothetical protein [Paenibacillus sp. N3.4]TXK74085.1 hypothetical protein FU659_29965 [Paenibacillus sp. N3.4]
MRANGVYNVDSTNLSRVKKVFLDVFFAEGKPLGLTQLISLADLVPSFHVTGYHPTTYATQIDSQHLKADGSNVVVKFKVANMFGNGITKLTADRVKVSLDAVLIALNHPSYFANFTDLGNGLYSFEVLDTALNSPLTFSNLTIQAGYSDLSIAQNLVVSKQAAWIERAAASNNWTGIDESFFTTGGFLGVDSSNEAYIKSQLVLAYKAHGNELTRESIQRIINGVGLLNSSTVVSIGDKDEYRLVFKQNVFGSAYYSVTARNELGYLTTGGSSSSAANYNFIFSRASAYPVVLSYVATETEHIVYASDNSFVPDFEIIFMHAPD